MTNYYSRSLHSNKLQKCYDVAPPRVQQFLEAEISFVQKQLSPTDSVLDLGCGYGRVALHLKDYANKIVGIDISQENIDQANILNQNDSHCKFLVMNAVDLQFDDHTFDKVICIQNGISAFHVNPVELIQESLRVLKTGGSLLFSSYADEFWEERMKWFEIQAAYGLIGEIDYAKTGNGVITCKDGFTAYTFCQKDFQNIANQLQLSCKFYEVDQSSLFCKIRK